MKTVEAAIEPHIPEQMLLLAADGPFVVDTDYVFPHQRLANKLAGLLASREFLDEPNQNTEESAVEHYPLMTTAKSMFENYVYLGEKVPEGPIVWLHSLAGSCGSLEEYCEVTAEEFWDVLNAAKIEDYARESRDEEGNIHGDHQFNIINKVIRHCAKGLKCGDPEEFGKSVNILTVIAADNKPEGWKGQSVKKHKKETREDYLFRKAIAPFVELLAQPLRGIEEYSAWLDVATDEEYVERLTDPTDDSRRKLYNAVQQRKLVRGVMEFLKKEEFNTDDWREEWREFEDAAFKEGVDGEADPDIVETNWTLLPPDEMTRVIEEIEAGGKGTRKSERYTDLARMRRLVSLANDWGQGAVIAVADLEKTGSYDYQAAILPQIEGDLDSAHAVADNPSSGNAIFVFRSESGMRGDRIVTWKEVLRRTKRNARMLGARRILHTDFVDENVMEYLTRPVRDLGKSGYRR